MKIFKLTVIFLALIAIEQLFKYIIRTGGGFYICNKNLAFGLKLDYFLFFILTLIVILLISHYKCQISNQYRISKFKKIVIWVLDLIRHCKFDICHFKTNFITLILILSGAISNLIDRLYFGCVIDFIDLKFWPVFNFADVYITIGVIMLIYKKIYSVK